MKSQRLGVLWTLQGTVRTLAANPLTMRDFRAMGSRPESRRAALLHELCARHGYCNDLDADSFTDARDVDAVVDAVLVAEGLDPATCERATRAPLAEAVNDWLFDPQGRGVRSGLPR
jgi:hypothetical protein